MIHEKEILAEDKLPFNQNKYNPTNSKKIQHSENVFVYDIELYPDEKNDDCVPFWVGFFPLSEMNNCLVNRSLNDVEFDRLKEKVNICKGEDCVDKMLTHTNKNRKGDPKTKK